MNDASISRKFIALASRLFADVRHRIWLGMLCAGAALITACAPPPDPGFRDQSVPITATTRFTPQNFDGVWYVAAAYPTDFFPACLDQRWQAETAHTAPRLAVFCGVGAAALDVPLAVNPRGVLQAQSADLDVSARALWVMWMDEDAQTAVIGTPSGEMGWILNRSHGLRADRFAAAREIMAFNGYDVSRLQEGIK
ncbi:lipocalin family protein [uncultured Roseobacter sp.]|uniref:lipocalin family protein n=1 Tax=uncultured Roseobacter sp. TaxID=114847 RepID=UPI00260A7134|nr:lipocalin family protein [uncultured Roseobacter sp.]